MWGFLLKLNLCWMGWVNHCTCFVSEEQWFSVERCVTPWPIVSTTVSSKPSVHGWYTLSIHRTMNSQEFETVSPQVAMLSPIFYQWFMCKLLKIPVLVTDRKAPEVCFLSTDMSSFECLIQLMNCEMKVFVPGVYWDYHWGVNHIISL